MHIITDTQLKALRHPKLIEFPMVKKFKVTRSISQQNSRNLKLYNAITETKIPQYIEQHNWIGIKTSTST